MSFIEICNVIIERKSTMRLYTLNMLLWLHSYTIGKTE